MPDRFAKLNAIFHVEHVDDVNDFFFLSLSLTVFLSIEQIEFACKESREKNVARQISNL